jgi:carbonic anhydrase
MSKKDAAAAADDATVVLPAEEGGRRRRFVPSRKLMIIGGGGLLAVALLAGATWALWPRPEPAVKSAKHKDKAKAAARKASEPAAAPSEAAASAAMASAAAKTPSEAATLDAAAPADAAAPGAAGPGPAPAAAAQAGSATRQQVAGMGPGHAPQSPAAVPLAPTAPAPAAGTTAEDPMDKLRRRLGETLGGTTKVEAGGPGELRLVAARPTSTDPAVPSSTRRAARGSAEPPQAGPVARRASRGGATAAAAHDGHAHGGHWDYQGVGGPEEWASLDPQFAACARGKRQSPIDIRDGIRVELEPVRFSYRPSAFRVVDNGHTVQVNVAAGNTIAVQGREYELQQFHFHRPSEEHVNGRQYDMVAHLVHKDAQGRIAVVAVLLDRGAAQPIVQAVWNNLPLEKHDEVAASQPLDLERLLPEDRRYYTYMGSLTTPPCSEGVLWMVLKHTVPVSPEQVAVFARLYPMNARPLQPLHGRLIKESN